MKLYFLKSETVEYFGVTGTRLYVRVSDDYGVEWRQLVRSPLFNTVKTEQARRLEAGYQQLKSDE